MHTDYSKDTVKAGLIGGRIGNKGAIGVSLKVAGTSLLFVNAHLAGMDLGAYEVNLARLILAYIAHEDKAHERVANMAKIKVIYYWTRTWLIQAGSLASRQSWRSTPLTDRMTTGPSWKVPITSTCVVHVLTGF